jgi:hypothetical protein
VHMAPWAGLTIAFEPRPLTFLVAQTQADLNPQWVIHPYNLGISATGKDYKDNWCYSCNGGQSDRSGSDCFEASVVDLYGFLASRYPASAVLSNISFIKIDTEGFDTQIIGTLRPLFAHTRPIIQIEWFAGHNTPQHRQQYRDAIAAISYAPFTADGKPVDLNTDSWIPDLILRPQ